LSNDWITFDLDETIMQNPFKKWVFPEVVSTFGKYVGDEHDILKWIVDKHVHRMAENRILEAYDWDHIIRELADELGVEVNIDVAALVLKHATPSKVYALEETMLDSLQKMKGKGYQLAVATNGYYAYQYPVLEALQLHTVFDEIITPDTAGFAKPNPLMLQVLQQKHNGNIVAHVGDRLDHDVVMANQLGIVSVFINKNIPLPIMELPIHKRKSHPDFLLFCAEKWHSENRLRNADVYEKYSMPDIVVQSIEELANGLDGLHL
jgi:FMN phosphatase YigB (HAD superfamily)